MSPSSDENAEHRHFFGAAKIVAGITLCSRVAGLIRDMILSRFLGATGVTSAFWMAFMIPNFFRRLFGEGALSAAFVPVFGETRERRGHAAAAALLANMLGLLGLLLCILCVLIEVGLLVIHLAAPGDASRTLILGYLAIMMPFMVTICLLALGSAALNSVGHFVFPAAAPILLNLFIIAAALGVAPLWEHAPQHLTVVAVSVSVAGVVQLAGLVWLLRAHKLPFIPKLRPLQPGVRRIALHMAPMLIPLGILQFNALLDKLIARFFAATNGHETLMLFGAELTKPLRPEAITWMYYAERLYQFPLGVLAIALATAVFPLFSRYAARGDTASLRASVHRATRLAVFEGLPSGVGLILLGGPLASLIFAGGKFSPYDAAQTAHVVRFYGLGMWAFCMQHMLLRAYFAMGDRMTPLKVAVSMVGLNVLLNLGLIWVPAIRHGAFGLSSSITSALTVTILAVKLRGPLGGGGGRAFLASVARIIVATGVMALAVWQIQYWLPHPLPHWLPTFFGLDRNLLYLIAAAVPAGVIAYFLTCLVLRAPEPAELLARPRRGDA